MILRASFLKSSLNRYSSKSKSYVFSFAIVECQFNKSLYFNRYWCDRDSFNLDLSLSFFLFRSFSKATFTFILCSYTEILEGVFFPFRIGDEVVVFLAAS
jgi:hypothetical protein